MLDRRHRGGRHPAIALRSGCGRGYGRFGGGVIDIGSDIDGIGIGIGSDVCVSVAGFAEQFVE
jgi:hypothetical protein